MRHEYSAAAAMRAHARRVKRERSEYTANVGLSLAPRTDAEAWEAARALAAEQEAQRAAAVAALRAAINASEVQS